MKTTKGKNTKNRGVMEFFIYPEKGRFVGVCLTFDIIEEGKDRGKVMQSILDAAYLHLQTVVKHKLPDELLNRRAPEKYWKKYFIFQERIKKQQIERVVADAIQRAYTPKFLHAQRNA